MRKLSLALLLVLMTFTLAAQKKQYDSLMEAFMSGGALRGDRGPFSEQVSCDESEPAQW